MKKAVYIRCPRCELNYIQKKDKFCPVCKAEMQAKRDYVDDIDLELCPICKTNYIQPDEIMCANCLKEHRPDEDAELADDWDEYMNREDQDDETTFDDEMGEMASVNDITKSSMLDDDEIAPGIDFDDEDGIDFEEDLDDEDDDDDDDFDDEDDDDDDDFEYDDED